MSPTGWQGRLSSAATKEAVVLVVNDFLGMCTPEELAQLPADCAPGNMESAEQVNAYALKLARKHTIGVGDASPLHQMATFFTRAALRNFQLDNEPSEMHGDRRRVGRTPPRQDQHSS